MSVATAAVIYIEVKQVDQRIRDNRRLDIDGISSGISVTHGRKLCMNG